MSGSARVPQAASLYEEGPDGNPVRGSEQSAKKDKERPKASSQRESHSGKSRKSHIEAGKYEEEISLPIKGVELMTMAEKDDGRPQRRKSSASSGKSPKKPSKPLSTHENRSLAKLALTRPKKDDPSHFGIPAATGRAPPVLSQMAAPLPPRPRALPAQAHHARPLSYHAAHTSGGYATGPPLSNAAWFQTQYAFPPPSFPPPSPSYFQYSRTPQAAADYFNPPPASTTPVSRPLDERFGTFERNYDPIPRATSAFGTRVVSQQLLGSAYDDGYASASEGPRRLTISRPSYRTKQEIDYEAMPPPSRPGGILRRPTSEYYETPDPAPSRDSRSVYREETAPARRPSRRRNSVSYDAPGSDRVGVFETANASRRRTSYYGPSTESTGSSDYVSDKVRQAQDYQEEVTGPPPTPLTADLLKRQQRRQAGSSRSTKSSGSRDDSDYRQSATTRTTRSGSNDDGENVTIKVTGTARVMVGGAQIDCSRGGEIEIKHQKSLRNDSERGTNSEYGGTQRGRIERIEDRRASRLERPPARSRMSSKSSYTRTTPVWI